MIRVFPLQSKLEVKMAFPLALLIIIIVSSITTLMVILERERLMYAFEGKARYFAKNLAMNSELGAYTEYSQYLNDPLRAIMSESSVIFAAIYDDKGKLIAQKHSNLDIPGIQDMAFFESLQKGRLSLSVVNTDKTGSFIDAYAPIVIMNVTAKGVDENGMVPAGPPEQKIVGVARVGVSLKPLRDELNKLLLVGIVFLVFFSVIGIISAIVMARKIVLPIISLSRAAKAIGKGELAEKIKEDRDDEIGELARTFNWMADSLQKRTIQIQRHQEDMELFLYSVSHDLKTPLTSIFGMIQLLEMKIRPEEGSKIAHYIDRIKDNIDWMNRMIQDVLTVSRIGREDMEFEYVQMEEITKKAIESFKEQIKEKGVVIEIQPSLPVVKGNKVRLRQVMENLIGNAIKFSKEDEGIRPWIRIGWNVKGDMYEIVVEDNGIGIPKEYQRKVFGLFQRVDSDREGTGVGLAVVKRIIQRHNGDVEIESEPGKGTAVKFTLPGLRRR